jgi:hypothetical protein
MSKNQHSRPFQSTKKLNLCPTIISACPPWRVADNHAGTKLSPICSPKCTRTTPNAFGARFQRDKYFKPEIGLVNRHGAFFRKLFYHGWESGPKSNDLDMPKKKQLQPP